MAWSKTKPNSALRLPAVERLGARERELLAGREQQLDADRRRPRASGAARPRGSWRRRPCCRRRGSPRGGCVSTPSSCSTSTGAASGTVSRWAQSRIVARAVRARDAGEQVAGVGAGLGRRCRPPRPRAPARAARRDTASAIARSLRDGLSISQRRTKSASRRSRSADAERVGGSRTATARTAHRASARARQRCGARSSHVDGSHLGRALAGALERRAHEVAEQRLRAQRARLELGVVLRGDEERVVGQLDRPRRAGRRARCRENTSPACSSRLRRWLLTS